MAKAEGLFEMAKVFKLSPPFGVLFHFDAINRFNDFSNKSIHS